MFVSTLALPAELTARPQWVAWRSEVRGSKPTKVPYSPRAARSASSTHPRTWGTYAQALACCERQGMAGIGYVFSPEDPYTGIDLDQCLDPASGIIQSWAHDIITALSSYTERSPSGTGVHIILAGKLPTGGRKRGHVEMYDRGRFFTMTGEHLEGNPLTIEPRQVELDTLHRQVWPELYERQSAAAPPLLGDSSSPPLDDEDILGLTLNAKNCEKFIRLWGGDTKDFDHDHSRADLSLCRMLGFYTQDLTQIDRLFRRSGLYRGKWDRPYLNGQTYRERTIKRTLESLTARYTPGWSAHQRSGGRRGTQK